MAATTEAPQRPMHDTDENSPETLAEAAASSPKVKAALDDDNGLKTRQQQQDADSSSSTNITDLHDQQQQTLDGTTESSKEQSSHDEPTNLKERELPLDEATNSKGEPSPSYDTADSDDSDESGEVSNPSTTKNVTSNPTAPPLPKEPVPDDDGWSAQWDATHQAWYFHNRFTGQTQWDNPRVPPAQKAQPPLPAGAPPFLTSDAPVSSHQTVGGYNPAIHGDYDPTAWYAQHYEPPEPETYVAPLVDNELIQVGFNRRTGQMQHDSQGPGRHSDEAKAHRQMNAFFDIDSLASSHDGRSLKAERSGQRLTKTELKQYRERKKAKKEERRRAWLKD